MQKLSIFAAVVASASAAAAQNPRDAVQVDASTTVAEFPAVASAGDLSAILYQDQTDDSLWVATSDGRGIDWNPAVRIDDKTAVTGNFIDTRETLRVANGNIFAAWRDDRNSADDDVYFTYSTDGGATWAANILVDKGYPAGANPVREYAFDVDGDNGAILIATDNGDEEMYLVTSTSLSTGTLSAAISATTFNGAGDTDAMAIDVEGDLVHIAFLHDVSGLNQTYYSVYDLATGTFLTQDLLISPTVQGLGGDSPFGISMDAQGSDALVAWDVDGINGAEDELWANVIQAGVAMGDVMVGNYPLGTTDVDNSDCLFNGDLAIVTWEDNRSGGDEAYVAMADISGGSLAFGADSQISIGGAGFPNIEGGGDYVAISMSAGGFPENAQAVASRDGGMTFGANFDAASTVGDVDFTELAYNALYGNFIISYLDDTAGTNDAFAGGFRVQSVASVGTFSAGNSVNFEVSGFGASEDGQFFGVIASSALGSLPTGDGRDLGLATGNVFYTRTRAGIPGNFSGSLAGGAGSTSALVLPSFPPTTLYFAAVGYDAAANLYSLTDIASVDTL